MSAVSRAEAEQHLRQWVESLRTTTERQGTGKLAQQPTDRDPVRYCCLGLGCVVAGIEHQVVEPDEDDDDTTEYHHYWGDSGEDDLAPREFAEWLGFEYVGNSCDLQLDGPDDLVCHDTGQTLRSVLTAAQMNDELKMSFSQIADCIAHFGLAGPA